MSSGHCSFVAWISRQTVEVSEKLDMMPSKAGHHDFERASTAEVYINVNEMVVVLVDYLR